MCKLILFVSIGEQIILLCEITLSSNTPFLIPFLK